MEPSIVLYKFTDINLTLNLFIGFRVKETLISIHPSSALKRKIFILFLEHCLPKWTDVAERQKAKLTSS